MAERRPLIEGLKQTPEVDRGKETAFVFGESVVPPAPAPAPAVASAPSPAGGNRVPMTTRIRTDLAAGLKRASLERQLAGQQPYTLQDIVEQVLEPWLRDQGYLS